MRLEFQLTATDFEEAGDFHFRKKIWGRFIGLVFGATLIICGFFVVESNGLISFILMFQGVYTIYSWLPMNNRTRFRDIFRFNKGYHVPWAVEVSAEDWQIETAFVRANYRWEYFSRFAETPRLFLVFVGRDSFVMIPKRAFANMDEERQFRAMIQVVGRKVAEPSQ